MKKLLFCLFLLGFSISTKAQLQVGITGDLSITKQPYEQWMVYDPPTIENGKNYSAGVSLQKDVGKFFLRTGLSYQYTTFKDLDNQLPLYGINLPSGFGFLSDPTLEAQTFHQVRIPLGVGVPLINREKLKIAWFTEVSANTTFSNQDTYSGYLVFSISSSNFLEKRTVDYKNNKLQFQGINLQTGVTLQHQIAPNYTLFWQPMISILEYRRKNDISETTAQEGFYLSNDQWLSLKKFGVGFGVLRTF